MTSSAMEESGRQKPALPGTWNVQLGNERNRKCDVCEVAGRRCSHHKPLSWDDGPDALSENRGGLDAVASLNRAISEPEVMKIPGGPLVVHKSREGDTDMVTQNTITSNNSRTSLSNQFIPQDLSNLSVSVRQIPRNPNHLNGLAPDCRLLLEYFAQRVTVAFSLHSAVQDKLCSTYIPMALQSSTGPHLLAAMLSLSAIHRQNAGVEQRSDLIYYFRYKSVNQLKLPIIGQNRDADDVAFATALMLCISDIMVGGEKASSWRIHLQGIAAIQRQMVEAEKDNPNFMESPIRSLLRRWSVALEVLCLLCGAPMSESEVYFVLHVAEPDGGEHYIDDFHGFTTKLVPVFGDIALMSIALEANQGSAAKPCTPNRTTPPEMQKECLLLIKRIEIMINERHHNFHPTVQASMTAADRSSFIHLNEAYHHVALLQIYVRILNLPNDAPIVQLSVQRTLYCISKMNFLPGACPAVAILQPVFTAGCEACGLTDRGLILDFLQTLERSYAMGNVGVAKEFLLELWLQRDYRRLKGVRLRWDDFMHEKGLELALY